MKVTLATHGGQMAAIHLGQPPQVVETRNLSEVEARELAQLVAAAKSSQPATEERNSRARDEMSYTITVEEGGGSAVLHQSDTAMSPEFASLLNWLEGHLFEK